MSIFLIGEIHDKKPDEDFVKDAKKIAASGEIILFLENEVTNDYKDGIINPGVYATEEKLVWEYTQIILALSYIYPIIYLNEYTNETLLQSYNNMKSNYTLLNTKCQEVFTRISAQVTDCLGKYIKFYISFLKITQEVNPVSKPLVDLLDNVISKNCLDCKLPQNPLQEAMKIMYEASRNNADYTPSEAHFRLFQDNLNFFNSVLRMAADLFCEYIHNGQYSKAIKDHSAIKKPWLDSYFNYKYVRGNSKTLLNYDLVVVDLRNQIFIERLQEMTSKSNKNIWFIVGEDHLDGLKSLFSSQAPSLSVNVVRRDDKQNLLGAYSNIINTQPYALRLAT